mmetsp:Transcript_6401/g.12686  ORF Transcript_6401/g.12686 Transcript_6401/m.12686 type:complete len:82 (-) Transcript_6401:379-624(-)
MCGQWESSGHHVRTEPSHWANLNYRHMKRMVEKMVKSKNSRKKTKTKVLDTMIADKELDEDDFLQAFSTEHDLKIGKIRVD